MPELHHTEVLIKASAVFLELSHLGVGDSLISDGSSLTPKLAVNLKANSLLS